MNWVLFYTWKRFLQIRLKVEYFDYAKCLLIVNDHSNLKIYQHARVVCGILNSPFILNEVIGYHLKKILRTL